MNYETGGIAFIGCIILGVGIGLLIDNPAAGSVIGVGVGFLAMALIGSIGRSKE